MTRGDPEGHGATLRTVPSPDELTNTRAGPEPLNPLRAPLPADDVAPAWPAVLTGTVTAGGSTGLLAVAAIGFSWSTPIRGDVAVIGLVCVLVAATLGAGLGLGVRRLGRAGAQVTGVLGAWLALPLALALLAADGLPTDSLWLLLAATAIVTPILAILGLLVGEATWRSAHPDPARMGIREALGLGEGVSELAAIGTATAVGAGLSQLVLWLTNAAYQAEADLGTVGCVAVASAAFCPGLGWFASRRGLDSPKTLRGRQEAGAHLWVAGMTVAFAIGPLAGLLSQAVRHPPFNEDLGPYPHLVLGVLADLVLSPVLAVGGAGLAELAWWVARRER